MSILHTGANASSRPEKRAFARNYASENRGWPTIIDNDAFPPFPRITAPYENGIGPRERDLWCEGVDYLARKGPLAFVSVTAAFEPVVRELSRKVKSYVALRQDRAGMRRGPFWGEVRETKARDETPKPGVHIVAPMRSAVDRDRLVDAINSSAAFGNTLAKRAPPVEVLKSYCLKEMTTQAAYQTGIRRIKGSHPLPEGGDRVRVSPAVRDALIRAERVEPYTRTYAKNPAAHHAWQFDASGQGLLFSRLPETDAPLCERGPVSRPKSEPAPMLRLFAVVGNVDVLETMKALGETHEEIARRLGISRPQATNILNGQFRPSRDVVRRVLELARAA
jgi:Helix-turn-helix